MKKYASFHPEKGHFFMGMIIVIRVRKNDPAAVCPLLLEFHYRGVSAPVEQEVLKLLCWYPVGESNP